MKNYKRMFFILSDKFNFINNNANERLKKLKLSIPTLDSSECKTLMGGDIYTEGAQDNWDYNWEQIFDQLGIKHP